MAGFDFTAAAALLCSPDTRAPRRHLRFEGAAEAIRHAIEQLSGESLRGSVLEVGEQRYDAGLIQKLYAKASSLQTVAWLGFVRRPDMLAIMSLTALVTVLFVYWQRDQERK